jgi:hypothetical protein
VTTVRCCAAPGSACWRRARGRQQSARECCSGLPATPGLPHTQGKQTQQTCRYASTSSGSGVRRARASTCTSWPAASSRSTTRLPAARSLRRQQQSTERAHSW